MSVPSENKAGNPELPPDAFGFLKTPEDGKQNDGPDGPGEEGQGQGQGQGATCDKKRGDDDSIFLFTFHKETRGEYVKSLIRMCCFFLVAIPVSYLFYFHRIHFNKHVGPILFVALVCILSHLSYTLYVAK